MAPSDPKVSPLLPKLAPIRIPAYPKFDPRLFLNPPPNDLNRVIQVLPFDVVVLQGLMVDAFTTTSLVIFDCFFMLSTENTALVDTETQGHSQVTDNWTPGTNFFHH